MEKIIIQSGSKSKKNLHITAVYRNDGFWHNFKFVLYF
jgi:hypothetical protein